MAKRPKPHKKTLLPHKKKQFGQHFLRNFNIVTNMISQIEITNNMNVVEIGCGDGFLTQAILEQTQCKHLLCFEIDPEWYGFVSNSIQDKRLNLWLQNILDFDWRKFEQSQPLIMLANLPYQITFPIFYRIQQHKHLFQEGVVMIQEEVAQKLVAHSGKSFGYISLFFQHHFEFKLMDKIAPEAFCPPPTVYSRLLHFKPRKNALKIIDEDKFWKFIKVCFAKPRKTLKNNLQAIDLDISMLSLQLLKLRAQQIEFEGFLSIWKNLRY